jgi:hypothetical protein
MYKHGEWIVVFIPYKRKKTEVFLSLSALYSLHVYICLRASHLVPDPISAAD